MNTKTLTIWGLSIMICVGLFTYLMLFEQHIQYNYYRNLFNVYTYELDPDGRAYKVIIQNADLNTFEVLSEYYSKDKNNVYYNQAIRNFFSTKIKNADPDTFEVVGRYLAKDKNNYYYRYEVIDESKFNEYLQP